MELRPQQQPAEGLRMQLVRELQRMGETLHKGRVKVRPQMCVYVCSDVS